MEVDELAGAIESVRVLSLRPGDRLVVRTAQKLRTEQREALFYELGREFTGHRVIVLEPGMELDVLRESER